MEHVRINLGSLRDDTELTAFPDLVESGPSSRHDMRRVRWGTYQAFVINPREKVAYAVGADTVDGDVFVAPRDPATMHHADSGYHLRQRCFQGTRMLCLNKR